MESGSYPGQRLFSPVPNLPGDRGTFHTWPPVKDDAFDITVLFQVIEHIALDKIDIFLREIKRVTRQHGSVILTAPNRCIRLLPWQKPWNPFHTKEYSDREIEALLSRYYPEVRVEGLFGVDAINQVERRRVKQKISKVYFRGPVKRHLINPIRNWIMGAAQTDHDGKPERREKNSKDRSRSIETDTADSNINKYSFTTSDLELRDGRLREALDLRATVLRVK